MCYYNLSKTRETQKKEEKVGLAEALLSPSHPRPAPGSPAEAGGDKKAQQNGHVL